MLLSDYDITNKVDDGDIVIQPYDYRNLQPASYDVHLADTLLVPKVSESRNLNWAAKLLMSLGFIDNPFSDMYMDMGKDEQPVESHNLATTGYWLPPGGVALGCTQEILTLSTIAPIAADIAGCSSVGRWFLFVHCTAGFIDPGWNGRLTLELFNASPWYLKLWEGMRIGQLRFWEMSTQAERIYSDMGHYAGSMRAEPSRYKDTIHESRTGNRSR